MIDIDRNKTKIVFFLVDLIFSVVDICAVLVKSSPKAEPFKQWLTKIGKERIDDIEKS